MKEGLVQIGDGIPDKQLEKLNAKEFVRCEKCVYREMSKCTIMDGLNITKDFFCGFAQKANGEQI